jgi:hypothetical protein
VNHAKAIKGPLRRTFLLVLSLALRVLAGYWGRVEFIFRNLGYGMGRHLRQLDRRSFLQGSGAFAGVGLMGLAGCKRPVTAQMAATAMAPAMSTASIPIYDVLQPIIPIRDARGRSERRGRD